MCNPFLVGAEMLAHSSPFVEASIIFLECSIFSLLDNAAEEEVKDDEYLDFGDNGRLKLNEGYNMFGDVRLTSLLLLLKSTQLVALVLLVVLFLMVTFRLLSLLVVLLCVLVVFLWGLDLIAVLDATAAAIFFVFGGE
jgi:hypothetical protein